MLAVLMLDSPRLLRAEVAAALLPAGGAYVNEGDSADLVAEPLEGSTITPPLESATCNLSLYNSTTTAGNYYAPGSGIEIMDFGTTAGGTICQFSFAYVTTLANPGTITLRFYSGTTVSVCPGTFKAGWNLSGLSGSPNGTPYAFSYTFTIPSGQEFVLPAGAFGFSYQFANASTGVFMATGGTGDVDYFWQSCSLSYFNGAWAGFYMQLMAQQTAPPNIQVNPTSMNFTCAGSRGTSADEAAPPLNAVEAMPAKPAYLVDAAEIAQQFAAGQTQVDVIVNLVPAPGAIAATNFNQPASLAALQNTVAQLQTPVLTGLQAGEFALRYQYQNMPSFSGSVSKAGLDKLLADPRVASIQPVRILYPSLAQGLALMNAMTYRATYNGAGISVAICDTGIDYTHPRLGGGGFPNSKVIGGYDFGDNDANPLDCQGHGTCCAGLAGGDLGTVGDYIGGVAPGVKLYALKMVPGCTGSATDAAMIASWDWCVTHKNDNAAYPIMVISTSFGGGRYYSNCDGDSPAMTTAANNAVLAGITVLASSGNDGYCDSMGWPACITNVISVGAVYDAAFGTYLPCVSSGSCAPKTASGGCATGYYATDVTAADKVTAYSNSASFLAIFAPSNQAYTTDIVGAGGYDAGSYTPGFGGTSAACPYAAGAVAGLQNASYQLTGNYLTPAQVKAKLIATGDPRTDSKVAITKPRVNLGNAIASIQPCLGELLTIQNTGLGELQVTSITKPSWLTFSPAAPFTIPAGGSLTLCVTANCGVCAGAPLNGNLVIASNDPDSANLYVPVTLGCSCNLPADFNDSCQVDADDLAILIDCVTGPGIKYSAAHMPAGCSLSLQSGLLAPDLDGDHDIDQTDFGKFQRCYGGPAAPANPNCLN